MNSKNTGQIIAIAIAIVIAVWASASILLNPTGGIAGLSKLITILGVILGLINPKAGLYFLVVQAVYCDEVKRVGVYYGVQSTQTVSEILIGPLLTICALNISFLHGILRRQFKIDFLGWVLYALTPIVAAILLVKGRENGPVLNIYLAGTTSAYLTLIPICYGVFTVFQDWVKFISFQLVVAVPAAAWGIWQYFEGFNQIEWVYALSGLSRVHSVQMMMEDPRIFGLFGSASAFGCVSLYGVFSMWRGVRFKKSRWWFLLLALIYLTATVLSHQRTLLVYPLIVLVCAYSFRRASTTVLLYICMVGGFVIAVMNSTFLLKEAIPKVNDAILGESRWSQNVMFVSTFSDRLFGWERLTRAESWSLFGTGRIIRSSVLMEQGNPDYTADDYSHDIINRILINFGAVGLATVLLLAGAILYQLHKVVFLSRDWQHRKDGAFVLGCITPTLALSLMAGDNFSSTPINLQIWSTLAGIFVLRTSLRQKSNALPQIVSPSPYPTQKPVLANP